MGSFELNPVVLSTHLLYVAEKYQPKSESFFSVLANKFPSDPELSNKALVCSGDNGKKVCAPNLIFLGTRIRIQRRLGRTAAKKMPTSFMRSGLER